METAYRPSQSMADSGARNAKMAITPFLKLVRFPVSSAHKDIVIESSTVAVGAQNRIKSLR